MKLVYKYLITFGIGFATVLLVANSKGIFTQTELVTIFHILTDSFCVPAVLITGMGGLVFVSNNGVFDALAYGMISFLDIFRKEKVNKFRTFYDYKESRAEKNLGFGFLIITGLVFMLLMGVMYFMYRKYA